MEIDLSKEPVIVVDDQDNQVEVMGREEAEADPRKIIRFVYILLYNDDDQVLLQRRDKSLKRFPNYWTVSASGAVRPEEGYIQAAERKLQDELGLNTKLFHENTSLINIPEKASRMTAIFIGHVKDLMSVKPNKVKISEVRWLHLDEAKKGYLLTPSCEDVLSWWRAHAESLKKNIEEEG